MTAYSFKGILNREVSIQQLRDPKVWDMIIIGGGATGLGIALDAASRGYKTLLLEKNDFSHGTSSRSTKLAHGGVRYLAQGNISLVLEALRERGLMIQNVPHLVHMVPFVIPSYRWWEKFYYGIGLTIYDWMAYKFRFGKTKVISRQKVKNIFDNLNTNSLNGGVIYYDGQFDDSRMSINIAQTASEKGGTLLNYFNVDQFIMKDGKVDGVMATDLESGEVFSIRSKTVVNATGVFADNILKLIDEDEKPIIKVSQGVHLILDRHFLKSNHALMIPKTRDGRILFIVPWKERLLVGTTDTPLDGPSDEPKALKEEIDFILETIEDYLVKKPELNDILSVFAGLRPLVQPRKSKEGTKEISRDHKLIIDHTNLLTITGGKWTTYRKMAQDTVDHAIKIGNLNKVKCTTDTLKIHGSAHVNPTNDHLSVYGSDAEGIRELAKKEHGLAKILHPKFPHIMAEVVWFIRYEMARTVEDILARRLRILFLDARVAIDIAPKIAAVLAVELNKEKSWEYAQTEVFSNIAQNYLATPYKKTSTIEKIKIK
ncbi:MAG: glycerol-3-phosphate dehydrogenase/oxidase [Flavobacteriaceae bacterium]|nr:glycerol-3-phosphate dehydrogenase/oxidase [Flavobacteriaceae bacterium]